MPLIDDYQKEEKIQGVIYNMSPSAGLEHANVIISTGRDFYWCR